MSKLTLESLSKEVYAGLEPEDLESMRQRLLFKENLRLLKPAQIVAEFDRGGSIESLARQVHRAGVFRYKWQSADHVRRCLYEATQKERRDGG